MAGPAGVNLSRPGPTRNGSPTPLRVRPCTGMMSLPARRESASHMKRRDFLKSAAAVAAASVSAPAVWSPAKAQSRQETLLIVSESGPNNVDIHGVGTNVPGYEVSWNCYDRLISHEMKTLPNGVAVLRPRQVQDGAGRGHERRRHVRHVQAAQGRQVPGRHAGHRQGREVVARSRRHRRRLPDLPDGRRLARPSPSSSSSSTTTPCASTSSRRTGLTIPDLAVIVPCIINSELVKKNATEKDPWGLEYTKQNTAGSGAYKVTQVDARHRGHPRAQRRLEARRRSRRSSASSGAWCRRPATAARCWSAATPTSPTSCRTRISSSCARPASSPSCRRRSPTASSTSA